MSRIQRTHKPFLPGHTNVLVPLRPLRDGHAALALYAPNRRRAVIARDAASIFIRVAGARALPWRAAAWIAPMEIATWSALVDRLHRHLGEHTSLAFYRPRDQYRSGFASLWIRNGVARAFVKFTTSIPTNTDCAEWETLSEVAASHPRAFQAPEPIARVTYDGWQAIAVGALASSRHLPASADPAVTARDVERCLSGLPRQAAVPDHWRPMHGDFTPWNLRDVGHSTPTLIDWADSGWGPPGADEVLYRCTAAAVGLRPAPVWSGELLEAREYWAEKIPHRTATLDAVNRATIEYLRVDR